MSDEASRRSPWVSETGADGATSRQAEEEAEPFQVKRAVQADMGRGLEPLRAALTNHRKGSFFTTADDEVKIYYNAQEATWAGQGQDWRVQESLWYSPSLSCRGCHPKTGQQPPDRLTCSQPAWFEAPGKGFMFRKAHWEAGAATPWAGKDAGERADWCTSGWDRVLAVGFSFSSYPLPLSWRATVKQ